MREALDFEGSTYVGLVPRILAGLPTTDMEPDWTSAVAARGLRIPGKFLLVYREAGGPVRITDDSVPLPFTVLDPRTGEVVATGRRRERADPVPDPGGGPRVYLCAEDGVHQPG
ncbi:hypothetical protein [Pseudonocardia lacus]|uniref:hypothetical protein n=1 Tax=Pseudonocardia lacus TaxID=2835865 RepID=UPI001BDBBFA6|nr:hypothetical protein [Pseudonocardia lacus]